MSVVLSASSSSAASVWSPTQQCYRNLLRSLREAYYHDRAKLFWARHRVRLEFYKFSTATDSEAIKQLTGCGNEIAAFVHEHMRMTVDQIVQHNETMMKMAPAEAKRFRQEYLLREKQHDSWCKQKIKNIMSRRPPPPYPFC